MGEFHFYYLFGIVLLLIIVFLMGRFSNRKISQLQTKLLETNGQLTSFFNNTVDAINITSVDGQVHYVNPAFEQMYGWTREELIEKKLPIIPEQLQDVERQHRRLLLEGTPINNWEGQFLRKDGTFIDVNASISPVRDSQGRIYRFAAITRDETERKAIQNNYQIIAEHTTDLIRLIDTEGIIRYASPSHQTLLGYHPRDLVGKPFYIHVHSDDVQRAIKLFAERSQNPKTFTMEFRKQHMDGRYVDVESILTPHLNQEGKLQHFIVVSRDISERKKYERKLAELAYLDPLTGVPNRRLLYKRLRDAMGGADVQNGEFALLFLDFDRFKWVNDTMGHDVGDDLLKQLVARIRSLLPVKASLYRLGGDEFAILLPAITGKEEVIHMVEPILLALREPWPIGNEPFATTCSIGISLYPRDGRDRKTIMKHADDALYDAKEDGRDQYCFFQHQGDERAFVSEQIRKGLEAAMSHGDLQLAYQPELNLATGQVECLEVLLRYVHPELGSISPDEFIPIAEESELIEKLTIWLLEQVGSQSRQWSENGYQPMRFGINLSPVILQQNRLFSMLVDALEHGVIHPARIEVEITEKVFLENLFDILDKLYILKELGVTVSLDDFGLEHASFDHLKHLPIDKIKIDRSVIQRIFEEDEEAMVQSMIALEEELELIVMAVGVETQEQIDHLREIGLRHAQGYYFSKPVAAAKIEQLSFLKIADGQGTKPRMVSVK